MVSGFWAVSQHGRLQSAFDKHADALAYAVTLTARSARVDAALAKLTDWREASR